MCINSSLFLFSYTCVFVCLLIHVINDYIFCISVISQEMVNYLLMVNYIYYWHLQNGSRCKMLLIEMLVSPYSPLYLICSQFVSGSLCLTYPHIDTLKHKLHLIKAIEILISTFFHFFFFHTTTVVSALRFHCRLSGNSVLVCPSDLPKLQPPGKWHATNYFQLGIGVSQRHS